MEVVQSQSPMFVLSTETQAPPEPRVAQLEQELVAARARIAKLEQDLSAAEARIIEKDAKLATAEELAGVDELTGLPNRRNLGENLARELGRVERQQTSLCVVLFDLDHFKAVNDTYGHDRGDFVLKELARVMQHEKRASDTFGRWGGEEFMLLLAIDPTTDPETIDHILSRYLEATQSINRSPDPTNVEPQTVSLGCVIIPSGTSIDYDTVAKTIKQADAALYLSKDAGRNRYTIRGYSQTEAPTASSPIPPSEVPVFTA